MSHFGQWYLDPENALEIAAIRKLLRCTVAEAVMIQQLGDLSFQIDALGDELGVSGIDQLPEEEEGDT